MSANFCGHCGTEGLQGAGSCSACGASSGAATPGQTARPPELEREHGILYWIAYILFGRFIRGAQRIKWLINSVTGRRRD
jgi:hypothetical protein